MQDWQIKILELEMAGLKHLDEFIATHKPAVCLVMLYLFTALGIGFIILISRGQRRRQQRGGTRIPPVIFIETPAPPPPPTDDFNPFPPPHHYRHFDCDDERWD